ncbi:MarR family winged helix-turn-helix transcriptional regulator [Loigolactobacillus bifermentans]|uniref:MarR family winged helix-turn-helix transcriptional regulator n=1 Tax=Loigolactobacillus bifermentans TaxID=1607 RepID=UPI000B1891C9|nr:MarR family transcriptional regulator [Loigolactobacillus bifermentans]QGG60668.1 MarR family transcriptional regulator [Loigolactobacillus bifermentans]
MPESTSVLLFQTLNGLMKQISRFAFSQTNDTHFHSHGRGRGRVLHILKHHNGIIQSELAAKLDIRPSSLTELLSKLENDGLITRQQDQNDRRLIHVMLTAQGSKRIAAHEQESIVLLNEVLAGLTPDEQAEMYRLTQKLYLNLKHKNEANPNSD